MSEPPAPLQTLAAHVAVLARGPEAERLAARVAFETRDREHPDLAALLLRRDADGGRAIRIIERLANDAPTNPLAALALLHMLRPELEAVRDRLVQSGRISALEAESDALAAAWEVVTSCPPPSRVERTDAIWARARRVSRIRRRSTEPSEPLPEQFELAEAEPPNPGLLPTVLAAAEAARVLTSRQVLLISWTRIEGWPLRQVAETLGRPYEASRKERRRAEAALAAFLRRYDAEDFS